MSYAGKEIWFGEGEEPESSFIRNTCKGFLDTQWNSLHSYSEDLRLFHYTSLEGLRGIVSNRSLWLTHINYLNDPNELEYGRKLILDVCDKLKKGNEKLIKEIKKQLKWRFNGRDYCPFIACFCEDGNLLSQWRSYAGNGEGYSLEFDFNNDTSISKRESGIDDGKEYFILRKIIYKKDDQIDLVKTYLELVLKSADKFFDEMKGQKIQEDVREISMASEISNVLFDMLFSFKNDVFKEEKEWRLVYVKTNKTEPEFTKLRNVNGKLIPYVESFLLKDEEIKFPLISIKIGPSSHIKQSKLALELLIQNEATKDNQIKIDTGSIKIEDSGYQIV